MNATTQAHENTMLAAVTTRCQPWRVWVLGKAACSALLPAELAGGRQAGAGGSGGKARAKAHACAGCRPSILVKQDHGVWHWPGGGGEWDRDKTGTCLPPGGARWRPCSPSLEGLSSLSLHLWPSYNQLHCIPEPPRPSKARPAPTHHWPCPTCTLSAAPRHVFRAFLPRRAAIAAESCWLPPTSWRR